MRADHIRFHIQLPCPRRDSPRFANPGHCAENIKRRFEPVMRDLKLGLYAEDSADVRLAIRGARRVAVESLEKNGVIIYAKSNTPEFAAGGNT